MRRAIEMAKIEFDTFPLTVCPHNFSFWDIYPSAFVDIITTYIYGTGKMWVVHMHFSGGNFFHAFPLCQCGTVRANRDGNLGKSYQLLIQYQCDGKMVNSTTTRICNCICLLLFVICDVRVCNAPRTHQPYAWHTIFIFMQMHTSASAGTILHAAPLLFIVANCMHINTFGKWI